jgi:hypothetical protein
MAKLHIYYPMRTIGGNHQHVAHAVAPAGANKYHHRLVIYIRGSALRQPCRTKRAQIIASLFSGSW